MRTSDRTLLKHKSDPEIGTEIPETEKLIALPKIIVPRQLIRIWQFTRTVDYWHNLCSGARDDTVANSGANVP